MNKKLQLGQSLFELVIAIGVISIVLVALVSLSTKSVSNSTYSKNNSLAARYNQESLEWIRGQRDTDWDVFIDTITQSETQNPATWCLSTLELTSFGSCSSSQFISGTKFTREATFTYNAGPPAEVTVLSVVSWTDSAGKHNSESTTTLTNWK